MEPVLRVCSEPLCRPQMLRENPFRRAPYPRASVSPQTPGDAPAGGRPCSSASHLKRSLSRAGRAPRRQLPGSRDEKLDTQRNRATCPRTHRQDGTELNFKPRIAGSFYQTAREENIFFSSTLRFHL